MEQQPILPAEDLQEPAVKQRVLSFCHAILILAAAYMLIYALFGVFEHNGYPLVFLIGVIALFSLTLLFGLLSGGKLGPHAIAAMLSGLIAGLFPCINGGISLFGFVYLNVLALSYTYFVLSLFQNHNRAFSGGVLILDLIKATFVYPFLSFAALFTSLFRRSRGSRKSGHGVLFVFVGIAAALIIGGIVIALLSYDPKFKALITFDWDWDNLPNVVIKSLLTVPLAALLFGAFASSHGRKLPNMSTPEVAASVGNRMRKVPAVVFVIPAAVLTVIYGLFFFTQWDAYVSAFSGVLPSSFTAAEYARSGFFELCAVAAINAVLGILLSLFMKRNVSGEDLIKKIINTIMAIMTLILIATALSKMLLYIERFDLTVSRLTASAILILIAVGFVLSLLAQWIKQIKVMPILVVCVSVLLLIVPFVNVRGRIARYNVDQYLLRAEQQAENNKIDIYYLTDDLGSAGVPDAIRLWKSGVLSEPKTSSLENTLRTIYLRLRDLTVSERSLADVRALSALEAVFGAESN